MQVLAGDVRQAAESFAAFYGVWQRFGVLPERYFFVGEGVLHPTEHYYPLRPELLESAFYLHQVPELATVRLHLMPVRLKEDDLCPAYRKHCIAVIYRRTAQPQGCFHVLHSRTDTDFPLHRSA